MIILANKPIILDTFEVKSRKVMESRFLRKPIAFMKNRVESFANKTDKIGDLRYIIYSVHDT